MYIRKKWIVYARYIIPTKFWVLKDIVCNTLEQASWLRNHQFNLKGGGKVFSGVHFSFCCFAAQRVFFRGIIFFYKYNLLRHTVFFSAHVRDRIFFPSNSWQNLFSKKKSLLLWQSVTRVLCWTTLYMLSIRQRSFNYQFEICGLTRPGIKHGTIQIRSNCSTTRLRAIMLSV